MDSVYIAPCKYTVTAAFMPCHPNACCFSAVFLQLLTYAEKSAILSDAMAVSLSFTTSWGTFLVVCVIVHYAAH